MMRRTNGANNTMPFQTLFTVPYVYESQVLRRRHRIAKRIWLRDSTPVLVLELEDWEAPVRLTASLEHPQLRPSKSSAPRRQMISASDRG
jgi:hypothetical protein